MRKIAKIFEILVETMLKLDLQNVALIQLRVNTCINYFKRV